MNSSDCYRPALLSIPPALRWLMLSLWAAMMFVALPATADVSLRVEARPIEAPINAFVTVTDSAGDPVTGLVAADFAVTVDGVPVPTEGVAFSLPPKSSDQKVSVVFAMDYSGSIQDTALESMQGAVIAFINSMAPGDHAAIVKFNNSSATKASVIVPFTSIDGPSGTGTQALINGVLADYPGQGTNLFDAIVLSVEQFTSGSVALPPGPKAIIAISDGGDNTSKADLNTALAAANDAGVSIFTVGVGTVSTTGSQYLTQLAAQTGGEFYLTPTDQQISEAYVQVSELLNNEYLLSFDSSIADCGTHTIAVSVTVPGQEPITATEEFSRCTPIFAPNLRGLTLAAATSALTDLGLTLGTVTQQSSSTVAAGSVISQTPVAGTQVAEGSAVNLVVSSGPPPTTVPNVVGSTQAAATAAINAAALVVGTVTQQSSSTVAAGNVISQTPAGGTQVSSGSAVNLVISSGPAPTVPNVVGLTQAAATTAIANAGLTLGTVSQQSSATVAAGTVISQTPTAGTQSTAGASVSLVVSSGAAPPPAKKSGGGGATGPLEILTGLGLLALAGRRRYSR